MHLNAFICIFSAQPFVSKVVSQKLAQVILTVPTSNHAEWSGSQYLLYLEQL